VNEYKQPREDVRGEVRDGGLLSLDDAALPARNLLVVVAHHLAGACLVGNPAPKVARLSERIRNPQLGDLVYETTTLFRREHPGGNAFGYLVERRREWWSTNQDLRVVMARSPTPAIRPDRHRATCSSDAVPSLALPTELPHRRGGRSRTGDICP
jgi:hypothetical protein